MITRQFPLSAKPRLAIAVLALGLTAVAVGPRFAAADGGSDAPPPPAKDAPAAEVTEDVVVSATRVERSVEDVPLSVTVMGPAQIEHTPAQTTDDLLRTVPGVNMPPTSSTYLFPTTQTFSMRGAGARRALVLQDGVPATDPFSGSIEWNKIPLVRLERAEVVRGGGASVFGSQALGGLVNFVTRRADRDAFDAEGGIGSYFTRNASFAASHVLGGGLGVEADGSWFETDGYQHESERDRGAIDIPMPARHAAGRLRTDWTDGDATAGLAAAASDEQLSLGTPLSNQNRQIQDLSGSGGLAAFGGRLAATGYFQHQRLAYDNTAFFAGQGRNAEFRANHHEDPIQGVGGSLLWSRETGGALPFLAAGVDVQNNRGEDRADNYSPAGDVTQRLVAGGQQTFTGVFAEASLVPSPGFEILASARYDFWRNYDGHQSASPGSSPSIAPRSEDQFDPRLAIRWSAGGGFALRAAGYRAFRAPTLRELYYQTLAKTQQTLSNPGLGPEHSWGGEAGIDFSRGSWSAAATGFVSRIEEIIGQVEVAKGPPRVLESFNVGNARSEGAEASVTWKPAPAWRIDGSWTYTEARVVSSDLDSTLVDQWIAFVPRNAGGFSALWHDAAGRSAALRARTYSRQYVDASNRLALDPAAVFDLEVKHPLWGGASLSATCTNLFDRRFVVDLSSGRRIGDPRMFLVSLSWNVGSRAARPPA
ncbi:MAG TPA: TonB-dependent receptor [Thermoanaerobaculia bacterium]|nr:TonB-dependent receptor [Thermoanaerobaculia bacterium]